MQTSSGGGLPSPASSASRLAPFCLLTQYRCHETTLRDSQHHPLGPPLHLAFSHALDSSLSCLSLLSFQDILFLALRSWISAFDEQKSAQCGIVSLPVVRQIV